MILHPCAQGQNQQCEKPSSLDHLLPTLSEVRVLHLSSIMNFMTNPYDYIS